MTFVTHMSRRDNAVTPENVTRDFGVSHGHVTATRPDPTRPLFSFHLSLRKRLYAAKRAGEMNEAQKRETFHAAIELLVERAVTKSRPDNAGAYSATVRADLSTRYRDAARDMYRQHGELTADELAEILEPSTPVRVERKRTALDAEIEANAERLKALPDRTPTPLDEAKRRLEAMRSTLRNGIQKLTPEQENTTHA